MSDESNLSGVIAPERVSLNTEISSKKKLLEKMAELLASDSSLELKPKEVLHLLLDREKVGNTGIGEGIALPHSRCAHVPKAVLAVVTTHQAVDYDSIDSQPVQLAFGLLVPQEANAQHLTLLSKIAQIMRVPGRLDTIVAMQDAQALLDSIMDWEASS